jgi:hypothetical protein
VSVWVSADRSTIYISFEVGGEGGGMYRPRLAMANRSPAPATVYRGCPVVA